MTIIGNSKAVRGALTASTAMWLSLAAVAAQAQDVSAGGTPGSPQAAAPDAVVGSSDPAAATPAAASSSTADIVVTGSRIARRDFSSDTPLVTVTTEALENTADVSLDQSLKELPQFAGGVGQTFSAQSQTSSPTASPGISTLNLRGLNSNRTLILLDGRRTQPANASLSVDINTIPAAAIDGVEVITGGAGATYGADAVAGVVNFKLKRNFSGVNLDAQMGLTERGDGRTSQVSLLIGSNFAEDRGNALFGISYADRKPIYNTARPFQTAAFRDPDVTGQGGAVPFPGWLPGHTDLTTNVPGLIIGPDFPPAGDAVRPAAQTRPSAAAVNAVFGRYGVPAGRVSPAATTFFFNRADRLQDVTMFTSTPAINYRGSLYPDYKVLSNGNLATNNLTGFLSLPLERYSMFGHAYYDVSDDLTFYAQGNFNQTKTVTQSTYAPATGQWGVGVQYDAATCGRSVGHEVPADFCQLLNSRAFPNDPWQLDQVLTFMGPQSITTTTFTYEVLAGLRGNLGIGDLTFDVFGSHGKTHMTAEYDNYADLSRYQALVSLPNWGANSVFSNSRVGLNATCSSGFNPFLNISVTQDCRDIIESELKVITDIEQTQAEIDFQGSLFQLPAGELRFALGADYRRTTFSFDPDAELASTNITSAAIGQFETLPAAGVDDVKEIYGELLIPVLKDLPFIQDLSLNAGYRFSKYKASGSVETWKITGDWDINDWLKLRGGYQVANRAPNIAELFQGGVFQIANWTVHDLCSNLTRAPYGNVASNPNRAKVQQLCTTLSGGFPIDATFVGNQPAFFPFSRDLVSGNTNLKSEKAKTWTAGIVLRSPFETPFLRRLSLSVDYYNIRIDDTISVRGTEFTYDQCFNRDGVSNPTFDPNNQFCRLILRSNVNGYWLGTIAPWENLGTVETAGFDATLSWSAPVPGIGGQPGSLFTNVAFNYLDKFDFAQIAGGQVVSYKDTLASPLGTASGGQFKWKLNTTVGYTFGPGTLTLNWRHLPKIRNAAAATTPNTTVLPTKAYDIFDLSARVSASSNLQFRMGVDNLFDRQPPLVGVNPGVSSAVGLTDPLFYDVIGRRYYLGVTLKL